MIYKQSWIERNDLKANPNVLFLFGDNLLRQGYGGQAKAMRGEPNAVGIPTKAAPAMDDMAFFTDADYNSVTKVIALDMRRVFAHRDSGGSVVIPLDGLGTGLSELPTRAPRINQFLERMLEQLEKGMTPPWKTLLNN